MAERFGVVHWVIEDGVGWEVNVTYLIEEGREARAVGYSVEAMQLPQVVDVDGHLRPIEDDSLDNGNLGRLYNHPPTQARARARQVFEDEVYGPRQDPPEWLREARPSLPTKLLREHTPSAYLGEARRRTAQRAAEGREVYSPVVAALIQLDAGAGKPGKGRRRARSLLFDLELLEVIEEEYAAGFTLEHAAQRKHVSRTAAKDVLAWARSEGLFEPTSQGKRSGPKRMTAQGRRLLEELRGQS